MIGLSVLYSTCCQATAVYMHVVVRPLTLNAFLSLLLWELRRADHMLHVYTAASDKQKYAGFFSYRIARREPRYRLQFAVQNQTMYFLQLVSCYTVSLSGC